MAKITGRKQLVGLLLERGHRTTDSTIYRWEKLRLIPNYPAMKKLKHSGQLVYTEEHVAAIVAYMEAEEAATPKMTVTSETSPVLESVEA
jgi:hypothetical protein